MNLSILTLSVLLISSCVSAQFPSEKLYVPDLSNKVCAEYAIVDLEQIKFALVRELPLEPKGPCDRMAGFSRSGFKQVQNWIRDQIRSGK